MALGQLVGYPIIKLPRPLDVVAYVRRMEQLLIDVCAELGLSTLRVRDAAGSGCRPMPIALRPQDRGDRDPGLAASDAARFRAEL